MSNLYMPHDPEEKPISTRELWSRLKGIEDKLEKVRREAANKEHGLILFLLFLIYIQGCSGH